MISSSARALYALRILKQHGMNRADLQKVFQSTVISRLQYASPAWWGFTTAAQRDRFEAFLRKSVKTGFYSENSPCFVSICDVADDNYLHSVEMNKDHILHSLLPPKVDQHYDMRRRKHNYTAFQIKLTIYMKAIFSFECFINKSSSLKQLTK